MNTKLSRRRLLRAAASLALAPLGCKREEEESPRFDDFIEEKMVTAHVPGLSAAVVRNDDIVWSGAYGLADVDSGTPVTPDTLFEVGSISKTVLATAVMQEMEKERVGLDDPVAPHLDFVVSHPAFPNIPITWRMLLTH